MARRYMAQLQWKATNNLPEDDSVNTFHFRPTDAPGVVEVEAEAIAGALANAFTTVHAGSLVAPAAWLNPTISRAVKPVVTVYKSETYAPETDMGPPVYETSFVAMPAVNGATHLPREVALCLTFHGNLVGIAEDVEAGELGPRGNIHPRARARGRIYLGPLVQGANNSASGRPDPDIIRDLAAAGDYLLGAPPLVAANLEWCVYSRANEAMVPVTGGWVDNEFDTQRRRGLERTSRTLFGTGLGL